MTITDSHLADPVRPAFLDFGQSTGSGPLAHMVEHDRLAAALRQRAAELGVVLVGHRVAGFREVAERLEVVAGSEPVPADLLVAADGAASPVRDLAGIATSGWNYDQSGIVATVEHELDHDGRAVQHFLPAGPFARLPLTGRRSSIVWTETRSRAAALLAFDDAAFTIELEARFGHDLGRLQVTSPRAAYPLRLLLARSFVGPRLALVGDAAHVIHPLAGQGFNLGLRDVAALTDCIADAARLGLPVGSPEVLRRYERWRRADSVVMGLAMDGMNRLFSNESSPLRVLRDAGLGLFDRLGGAKRLAISEASGAMGTVPSLMR